MPKKDIATIKDGKRSYTLLRGQSKAEAKEEMIRLRADGMEYVDCAAIVGISVATLNRWRNEDEQFEKALSAGWFQYKRGLIRATREKKPDFLLQTDFSERFGVKEDDATKIQINQFLIGDTGAINRLARLVDRVKRGTEGGGVQGTERVGQVPTETSDSE